MLLLVLLLGFILGILFILAVQYFTLSWIFILSPKAKPGPPPPYSAPSLPEDLSQKVDGPFREETCQWVNFCGAFLFQELRESNLVKKAIITKLNEEFKEFLLKKTTGQLMHQVTVRDYFLGNSLPQFNSVQVLKVRRDEQEELLNEVTVGFDVDYKGRALIAIDLNMLLGKTASITVELVRLEGKVRLQFIREPYTHWSIAFIRDPILEFRVAPEFQGRAVSQLTSLIERLIIRFIKRKHTLPRYKVRRSPLFPKMLPQAANLHLYMHDTALTEGVLELEILGCSRLLAIPEAKRTFCTAAITNKPWKPLNRLARPSSGPMLNLTVERSHGGEYGFSFQRYQDTEMDSNCIVVSEVSPNSPAHKAGVMKGDIIFLINGVEVKSVSKAKSLIDTNSSSFIITVQRVFTNHIPATGQLPALMLEQFNSAPTKQITEYDTEVASLLGGFTPEPGGADDKETASKHGSFISEKSDPHSDTASRVFPDEFPNAELFCPDQQQRTKYKFYSRDISAFPDKFTFNIMPEHKYLSIVLWYDSPLLQDAVLAGHVTIPLSDISVECIATASGKHKQRYVLVPTNPLIPGMSKTHAKHIAAANEEVSKPWLAPGVANKHAQFAGDILLSFSHTPKCLLREDRPDYVTWNRPIAMARARQREQERKTDYANEDVQANKNLNVGLTGLEDSGSSYDALATDPDGPQSEEPRKEGVHSFITLTSFNQSEHDTCKICYGELGTDLVSKCQNCALVCHHKCSLNAHQKLACPHTQKARRVPSVEFHTPLDARISVNAYETNAERILLAMQPTCPEQMECIADTSRFQDVPLPGRLEAYREQILKMNDTLETHEEVIESLKHQLEAPCPPEALQPIKSQLSKTEDKQRAIATLLIQYCEGLKVLESVGESGSELDD